MDYLNQLLSTLNEMTPYLLLGFLISGVLHVYVPRSIYARFLHRKGFGSVVGAALLGVPLPLCSCGVIPTAVSLKKQGASDGATVSFLVATPQTGIDSILATYSLLGLPFAIIRPIAAFIIALFAGGAVDIWGKERVKKVDPSKPQFRYLGKEEQSKSHNHSCGCGCSHSQEANTAKGGKLLAALKYGYVDMIQDFGKWLVIGLLVAAAITTFIPDSVFILFQEYYIVNIMLILLISAPMYICATASIPIALSLILRGVSPGAAFVLLIAGPATNFASLIILNKEIGLRKTIIYLISIIVGAIVFAMIIDFVLPPEWFASISPTGSFGHHHEHNHDHDHSMCSHGPIWWQTTTSIIFITLFINAFIQKFIKGKRAKK